MNTDSLQNTQIVTMLSAENISDSIVVPNGQIGEVLGLPIMLLVITYGLKMLIHNRANWSDLGKAFIEFPIDFMSIAISVYVTYRYLSVTGNVFTVEILYFILATIVCCFFRKVILNSCGMDKIKKRYVFYIVMGFLIEYAILVLVIYCLLLLLKCTQI